MDAQELLAQARETLGVRREYGEPYEHNGITVIPVSTVRGGGGGGSGHDGQGRGTGGGFGLTAKPSGAWVIRGDDVEWKPAVDPMRILLGAELVAALALWRTRPHHHHHHRRHQLARKQLRKALVRRQLHKALHHH